MEQRSNDTARVSSGEEPDPGPFDQSKSHMDWRGIELEPLRWEIVAKIWI